ncbi:MAG TPA: hypothetical protein PK156_19400, partial [Polyangium sp.]|nr:hypothetical protein [Polyangium sp.]
MRTHRASFTLAALLSTAICSTLVGCGDPIGNGTSNAGGSSGGGGNGGGNGGGSNAYPECAAPGSEEALLAKSKQILGEIDTRRKDVWKSIFGLANDGTIDPNGLDGIDWDPSHDSVYFTSLDVERVIPLFISNDAAKATSSSNVTLGIAADTGTSKYVLLGANPFSDLVKSPPMPGSNAAKMETVVMRLMQWLTGKDPGDGTGMKIVLAQLADTYWFDHDKFTANFFADKLPKANVSPPDMCDGVALAGCLDNATLLVISDEDGADDEHDPHPSDRDTVMAAIDGAMSKGIPILYVQYDGQLTPLGERMMQRFRVKTSDNYWDQERLTNFSPKNLLTISDELGSFGKMVDTLTNKSLTIADYQSCIGQASQYDDCDASGFVEKIGQGTQALRATMNALDESATNPYEMDGFRLIRTFEQLGQTYRTAGQLEYPIDFENDPIAFARGIFAD